MWLEGVAINFDFPAGGGHVYIVTIKSLKKKSSLASLARVLFIDILYLVRQGPITSTSLRRLFVLKTLYEART